MSTLRSSRLGAIVLLIALLAGLAIALYAYFTPLTGVTGTIGALVATVSCLALVVMALLLAVIKRRGASIALRILILLGLTGTFLAGLLLHQWWIGVAMVVGLIGLIFDMLRPSSQVHPTQA